MMSEGIRNPEIYPISTMLLATTSSFQRRNSENNGYQIHKFAIPASKEELPVGGACCHVEGTRIAQQLAPW